MTSLPWRAAHADLGAGAGEEEDRVARLFEAQQRRNIRVKAAEDDLCAFGTRIRHQGRIPEYSGVRIPFCTRLKHTWAHAYGKEEARVMRCSRSTASLAVHQFHPS